MVTSIYSVQTPQEGKDKGQTAIISGLGKNVALGQGKAVKAEKYVKDLDSSRRCLYRVNGSDHPLILCDLLEAKFLMNYA